jgi:hypothetical protein
VFVSVVSTPVRNMVRTETSLNNFFLVSQKSKPKNHQNRLSEFRFDSVQTEKKINGFEDPLGLCVKCGYLLGCPRNNQIFFRFKPKLKLFRFVLRKFCLFQFFRYRSKTPKQIETNRKKCFLVSRNKPKNNQNSLSFGSNRKKNLIVSRTP